MCTCTQGFGRLLSVFESSATGFLPTASLLLPAGRDNIPEDFDVVWQLLEPWTADVDRAAAVAGWAALRGRDDVLRRLRLRGPAHPAGRAGPAVMSCVPWRPVAYHHGRDDLERLRRELV